MKFMKLAESKRQERWASLAGMHRFLEQAFAGLNPAEACIPGPEGAFSPVEQVWHLADLEAEGFGMRIQRLRREIAPVLADFDGSRVARERGYRSLSLSAGLAAFQAARRANIAALQTLSAEEWARSGTQEGVGPVSLCDMPEFIFQHDQAHQNEIRQWARQAGKALQ